MVAVARALPFSDLAVFAGNTNRLTEKVVELFQPHQKDKKKPEVKKETFEELLKKAIQLSFESSPCLWEQYIIFHLPEDRQVKRLFQLAELVSIAHSYTLGKTDGKTWAIVHFNVAGAFIARRVGFRFLPDEMQEKYRGKLVIGKTARRKASENRGQHRTGHSAVAGPKKGPSPAADPHGHGKKQKKS